MAKLRVTQVRSLIGSNKSQRATMATLKLRRIRCTVELEDTPSVQGALRKVRHLVEVEEVK